MKILSLKFVFVQATYPAEKLSCFLLWGETEVATCHFSARSVSECSSLYSQTSFNTSAIQRRAHLTAVFQVKYALSLSLCRTTVLESIKVLTEILPTRENRLEATRPVAAMEQSIFSMFLTSWGFPLIHLSP